MAKKLIQFYATEKAEQMLREIQEYKGYSNRTVVIMQAIIDFHDTVFKDYIYKRKGLSRNEQKKSDRDIKNEEIHEERLKICNMLEGIAVQDISGAWYCRYYEYDGKKRNEQEVPFTMLSEELVRNQYYPSKEKVLGLRKDGKTEY